MKNRILLYSIASLLLLCACNKDRNEKSVFYIDGKKYQTRNFKGYIINGTSSIDFSDKFSGKYVKVSAYFNLRSFPQSGEFPIRRDNLPTHSLIGLVVDTTWYRISLYNQTSLTAVSQDGMGKYTIEPTWLYNQIPDPNSNGYLQGNDSILFSGVIYEPKDITVR